MMLNLCLSPRPILYLSVALSISSSLSSSSLIFYIYEEISFISYCIYIAQHALYSDVTVTYDATNMTADFRFHGDREYAIGMTVVEGSLSYSFTWPRGVGL